MKHYWLGRLSGAIYAFCVVMKDLSLVAHKASDAFQSFILAYEEIERRDRIKALEGIWLW